MPMLRKTHSLGGAPGAVLRFEFRSSKKVAQPTASSLAVEVDSFEAVVILSALWLRGQLAGTSRFDETSTQTER